MIKKIKPLDLNVQPKPKLVILDRDGVINRDSPHYIKSPEEFQIISGSLKAIVKLNHAGIKVAIATNQSGIARSYYNHAMLAKIHQKMHDMLKHAGGYLDAIAYCPHHPDDQCDCRKPKAGMLLSISQQLTIPLDQAIMIGDSESDIQAGLKAGAQSILIHPNMTNKNPSQPIGVPVFPNLLTAVNAILQAIL